MRSIASYKPDQKLLFAWECPILFKNICNQFNEYSNKNKILYLKFIDYQIAMQTPTNEIQTLQFLMKLKKNNRFTNKSFNITIKNSMSKIVNNSENLNINNENNQTILIQNLEELLYIDFKPSKNEDIFFELKSLDQSINFLSISMLWNVKHFYDKNLYLNGQMEKLLRIKYSDLLIGNNLIICEITNINSKQTFKKIYNFNVDRNPYGGNCLVSPNSGISMFTNFTVIQEGWKGGAMPLLFKIKCKTNSNILLDLSDGGFFTQNYTLNLPEGNNNIFLEVTDKQGRFALTPCYVNIKKNNNQQSIENFLTNVFDISQKMVMMDVYTSKLNSQTKENQVDVKTEIKSRFDILNTFYHENSVEFNEENFLENFDIVISFLLELSKKNLKDINFKKLYDILDIIIIHVDPFLDDLNKMSILYKILDNFSENIKNK